MARPTRHALRRTLIRRLGRNGAIVVTLIAAAVGGGAAGYHWFAGLSWTDATLNAAMILTGMGPVDRLSTPGAKLLPPAMRSSAASSS